MKENRNEVAEERDALREEVAYLKGLIRRVLVEIDSGIPCHDLTESGEPEGEYLGRVFDPRSTIYEEMERTKEIAK